jgi:hypothetical protein
MLLKAAPIFPKALNEPSTSAIATCNSRKFSSSEFTSFNLSVVLLSFFSASVSSLLKNPNLSFKI